MEERKELDKIIEKLAGFDPDTDRREELIRNVMESTSETVNSTLLYRIIDFLFGWTDVIWIRSGLVTISLALVFVFVLQQFSIIKRIDNLEIRMVESNTEQIIRQQGENVLLNSVLMEEVSDAEFKDSIKVADRDLRNLVESYTDLQRRYQELKNERYAKQIIEKNINREL